MRYQNLRADFIDRDFLDFTNGNSEGNIVLVTTDELVNITNDIRQKMGHTDLVGVEYENEVYYDFYLMFDNKEQKIRLEAECNYGEKDDKTFYELPMSKKEKISVMWQLNQMLAEEIFNS